MWRPNNWAYLKVAYLWGKSEVEGKAYEAGADAMYEAIEKAASEGRVFTKSEEGYWILDILPEEG